MSGAARRATRTRNRQRCVLGIDVGGTSIRAGLFVPRSGSLRHVRAIRTEASSGGRHALARAAAVAREVVEAGSRSGLSVAQGGHRCARARRPGWRDREPRSPAVAIDSSPQGVRCLRRRDHRVRCAGGGLGRSAPRRSTRQSDVPVCRCRHGNQLDPVHRRSALSSERMDTPSRSRAARPAPPGLATARRFSLRSNPARRDRHWSAVRKRWAITPRTRRKFAARRASNRVSRARVVDAAATELAAHVAILVNALDPSLVVLGGGLGAAPGRYWNSFRAALPRFAWGRYARRVRVRRARLGARGGMIGAALSAVEASMDR